MFCPEYGRMIIARFRKEKLTFSVRKKGKMEAWREFQFLEVIGTNVLANEVVRHFSNLTEKECWESAKRVCYATHQSTCRDSIYSKGKVQRHLFGEPASSGTR